MIITYRITYRGGLRGKSMTVLILMISLSSSKLLSFVLFKEGSDHDQGVKWEMGFIFWEAGEFESKHSDWE